MTQRWNWPSLDTALPTDELIEVLNRRMRALQAAVLELQQLVGAGGVGGGSVGAGIDGETIVIDEGAP